MIKHLLSILIVALFISNVKAQILDKEKLECEYKFSWVNDTTKRSVRKEDFMILKVGDKVSEFYSYNTFRVDSAIQADLSKGMGAVEMLAKRASYGKKGVEYHIFKNYPSGKMTVTEKVGNDNFKYEETLNQKWQIQPQKAKVNGYAAQKATCTFGGRQYTAWFTTEVPIATGPWKFNGLPGLILNVEDSTGDFRFELLGLHQVKGESVISLPQKSYINTTKEGFMKVTAKYYKDPVAYLIATSTVKITPANGNQSKPRPYNPIELY
ncbi:GLPGLI family protein [Mucilaginibacter sp. RCC_168]|uniref:GLPGLI family protein n=1 Tax=Mucilaginibacter sp. RCC_168 TaxID=3239221 RepID=UPI00352333DC